ncbi:MAG TPA: ABC transporter ATP-binding protein [Verrucomicrobiae bacterium]|nr:ABC transporter ATP-binding protein [Verrucomicrobiae bacterium]
MNEPKQNGVAVKVTGLRKTYGEGPATVQALRGVDLEVRAGELMMLVGPSGCGKTTLISIIAGILDQTDGDCVVFGHDYRRMSESEKTSYRGENIGFVFQAYNLIPTLTTAENAAVPLLVRGENRRQAIDRARDMLGRVGFDDRMMRAMPSQLSGGQQQRVAIARALVHEPKLIVCDEPTAALDHETGQTVMELLRSVALQDGRGLIVVTHDARIFEFADRIAKLDDGHVERVVNSPAELNGNRK